MALTYADIGAGVAGGTAPLYASYMNALREGISRRAAQVDAVVVLPDVVAAAGDAHAQMEAWLLAARTAVEVLIPSFYSYDSGAGTFAAWAKAALLTYIHATWVTTAFVTVPADWAPYTPGAENNFYACYFNEIYYALECLCVHDVTFGEGSAVSSGITHAGLVRPTAGAAFADSWAAALAAGWQAGTAWGAYAHSQLAEVAAEGKEEWSDAVEGTEQGGTVDAPPITPGTLVISISDDAGPPPNEITVQDDGAGGFVQLYGDVNLVGTGSVDYDTGVWTFDTDFSWVAGDHIYVAYTGGGGWASLNPTIIKATSAGVVVPDLDYALTDLWLPFNFTGSDPGATDQILSVSGGTVETANVWTGGYLDTWLHAAKSTGGWDNETVSPAYSFDLPSNTYGTDWEVHDWAILMQLVWATSEAAGYGRSDFGGYDNGHYAPW